MSLGCRQMPRGRAYEVFGDGGMSVGRELIPGGLRINSINPQVEGFSVRVERPRAYCCAAVESALLFKGLRACCTALFPARVPGGASPVLGHADEFNFS